MIKNEKNGIEYETNINTYNINFFKITKLKKRNK